MTIYKHYTDSTLEKERNVETPQLGQSVSLRYSECTEGYSVLHWDVPGSNIGLGLCYTDKSFCGFFHSSRHPGIISPVIPRSLSVIFCQKTLY